MSDYELNAQLNDLDTYTLNVELPPQTDYNANLIVDFRPNKTSQLTNDSDFITSANLIPISYSIIDLQNDKVDKITGKGLSTNDFTDVLKSKLDGIEAGAEVNTVKSVNGQTGNVVLEIPDNTGFENITGSPYDNTNLANALDDKQNIISDLSDLRSGSLAGATSLQPNDNITQLYNNAGYISQAVDDTSTTSTALGWSAYKLNSIIGDLETILASI